MGLDIRVTDELPEVAVRGVVAADRAAAEACEKGARAARARAPRDTGALIASIKASKSGRGQAQITATVHYARYQEFGVYGRRGQHFFRHGVLTAAHSWQDILREKL